ncbi:hypothetical protein NKG94_47900 [Micromonospora sp. M12]
MGVLVHHHVRVGPRRQKPGPYTGRVCVSRAKPMPSTGPATPPCASNGYGPKMPLSQSTISPVRSMLARAAGPSAPSDVLYALITGWPLGVVSVTMSYWPMAMKAR